MDERSCCQSSESCESCPLPYLQTFGLVIGRYKVIGRFRNTDQKGNRIKYPPLECFHNIAPLYLTIGKSNLLYSILIIEKKFSISIVHFWSNVPPTPMFTLIDLKSIQLINLQNVECNNQFCLHQQIDIKQIMEGKGREFGRQLNLIQPCLHSMPLSFHYRSIVQSFQEVTMTCTLKL